MVIPLSDVVYPGLRGSRCINSLSFIPNLHSGIPDNWHLTWMEPETSALRMVPLTDINTLTLSTTSRYTSFFL